MTRGRKKTTGRYDSREELVEWIWYYYKETDANLTDISKICKVSTVTVSKILDQPRPKEPESRLMHAK